MSRPTGGYSKLGFQRHRAVAMAAREQLGVWLDLDTGKSRSRASASASHLNSPRNSGTLWRPDRVGSFEFRAVRRDDGYAVQVRYVRNSPEFPNPPGSSSPAVGVAAADGEVPALPPAVMGAGTEKGGA